MLKFIVAGVLAMTAVAANAATITTADPQGWAPENVRTDGAVAITGTYAPAGETGSLQFDTNTVTPGQDKADYSNYTIGGTGRTLGALVNDGSLSYDYFVSSTTTGTIPGVAPALRLVFENAANQFGYLVWEAAYNGGVGATDTWVSNDILNGNFWMRTVSPGYTVEQYNVTLQQWLNGATFGGSYLLGADTKIVGIQVGVGSGWGGDFHGAVDHVNISFGDAGGLDSNFELGKAGAVPEPATWAMMIAGFGLVGVMVRGQRRRVLAA